MHSCIYRGNVRHRRFGSVEHSFRYPLFLMYLDLDEIDEVFRCRWLWSSRRTAPARFRRDDHFGDSDRPLSECVLDRVEYCAGFRPVGRIRLLTHLRYFGIAMNPVSFYFCFDKSDSRVEAVIAEVNNTPWGERHCYVIDGRGQPSTIYAEHAKAFHVSPFMPMDATYRWQIGEPGNRLSVHIENYQDGSRAFDATLSLQRRSITGWELARALIRYPMMTSQVTAGIYWQALRLWWKGATFFPHPRRQAQAELSVAASSLETRSVSGGSSHNAVNSIVDASGFQICHTQHVDGPASATLESTKIPSAVRSLRNCTLRSGITAPLARQHVLRQLGHLEHGRLILDDRCNRIVFGNQESDELCSNIVVRDDRFYRRLTTGGSLGLAESYLQGEWETDDLPAFFRICCRNLKLLCPAGRGLATVRKSVARFSHWLSRNTRLGSLRNIEAHYDLGNDFFQLFLDPSMMYSSAIFETSDMSLEDAQITRLDRVCTQLDLRRGDHVVEIGTGWGGFAVHAARNYGCLVTTTTISRKQYKFACHRVAKAGLNDRITVLCQDYRDLKGQFDQLVSLEMIEAVGHKFYDEYFGKCASLLKPNGRIFLQAIVMPEQRYAAYLKSVDFIQKYIFPGGCLPSVSAMHESVQRTSNLRLLGLDDFAASYAQTLREWRKRFRTRLDDVRELGYPERFIRMWDYYLCYCEGAFDERAVGVVHATWGN